MANLFNASESEIAELFETKPKVTAPVPASFSTTVAPASVPQVVVESAPAVSEPAATPAPVGETIASLSEIVQSLGKDDILTLNGKKVKAADIRVAIEDHENKKRWQDAQGERDRQIGEERKRIETFIPLIKRLESDPDFATVLRRAEDFYDNPELLRNTPAPAPAPAPASSNPLGADDLLGAEESLGIPLESAPILVQMKKKIEVLEKNQLLIAERDEAVERAEAEESLARLKEEVASYAKENNINWDSEREKKFLGYVVALSQGNDPDEKVAQEAFFLVTRKDHEAKIATTAADNAVAIERKAMVALPPTLSGGGNASSAPSLSPREVEILQALNLPSEEWPALAAT